MDAQVPLVKHVDKPTSNDFNENILAISSHIRPKDDGGQEWSSRGAGIKEWRPFFLSPATIAAFGTVFGATLIALEVVNKVAGSRGFGPTKPGNHYLWTYGPTACKPIHFTFLVDHLLQKRSCQGAGSISFTTLFMSTLLLDWSSLLS